MVGWSGYSPLAALGWQVEVVCLCQTGHSSRSPEWASSPQLLDGENLAEQWLGGRMWPGSQGRCLGQGRTWRTGTHRAISCLALEICPSPLGLSTLTCSLGVLEAPLLLHEVSPAFPFPEPEITQWWFTFSVLWVKGRDHCQGLHGHIQCISSLHKHHVLTGSALQEDLVGDFLGTRNIAACFVT